MHYDSRLHRLQKSCKILTAHWLERYSYLIFPFPPLISDPYLWWPLCDRPLLWFTCRPPPADCPTAGGRSTPPCWCPVGVARPPRLAVRITRATCAHAPTAASRTCSNTCARTPGRSPSSAPRVTTPPQTSPTTRSM